MTDASGSQSDLPLAGTAMRGAEGGREPLASVDLVSVPDRSDLPGIGPIALPYAAVVLLAVLALVHYGWWGFGLGVAIDCGAILAILLYIAGRPDQSERIVVTGNTVSICGLGADGAVTQWERFPVFGLVLERTELSSGEMLRIDLRHRQRCREIGRDLSHAERRDLWHRLTGAVDVTGGRPRLSKRILPTCR